MKDRGSLGRTTAFWDVNVDGGPPEQACNWHGFISLEALNIRIVMPVQGTTTMSQKQVCIVFCNMGVAHTQVRPWTRIR